MGCVSARTDAEFLTSSKAPPPVVSWDQVDDAIGQVFSPRSSSTTTSSRRGSRISPESDSDGTEYVRGETVALHHAANKGDACQVRQYLARGAQVNAHIDRSLVTPLHMAAWHGHLEIIGLLIAARADLEAQEWNGSTPLLNAAEFGKHDAVRALLAAGAKVSAGDTIDNTALHTCARKGYPELAQTLLEAGASLNVKNAQGYTPFGMAEDFCSPETPAFFKSIGGHR